MEALSLSAKQQWVDSLLTESSRVRRLNRGQSRAVEDSLLWQDLPLAPEYIDRIQSMGFRIRRRLRWLNAVSGTASRSVLEQIKSLPFVRQVRPVSMWRAPLPKMETAPPPSLNKFLHPDTLVYDYGQSLLQIQFHRIQELHNRGLTGQGVRIAMFDTGFNLNHPALVHLQSRVIAEYDFVQNDTITRNQAGDGPGQDSHGTITLSIIGGFDEGELIGPAFEGQFILAKTEVVQYERHIEEDNWAAAAEWAEALGADIVSSSLGYSEFDAGEGDYTYQDMDGNSTIVTRAANYLAMRGVLVVSSAGNEGNTPWHYITAPADGRYVLAVGAVNSSNTVASFSSRGPTYDGRIKPDVMGLGVGVIGATAGSKPYAPFSGTSVSCPLVAGICAQLLQARPQLNIFQLLEILRNSGDNSPPDNERGWGTVDALIAWQLATGISIEPEPFQILPPVPHPFHASNPLIFFRVVLPQPSDIRIDIFNILGQPVQSLNFSGNMSTNYIGWNGLGANGNRLSTGVYPYRVTTRFGERDGKLLIIR